MTDCFRSRLDEFFASQRENPGPLINSPNFCVVQLLSLKQKVHVGCCDLASYADLQHDLDQLPEEIQREVRTALGGLNEKLATDQVLANLGQAVEANNIAVRDALLHAQAALAAGRMKSCLDALEDAKNGEREAMRLTAQIQRFTEQLKNAAASVLAQATTRAAESTVAR